MIPAVLERCAGIDVGKECVVVCLMVGALEEKPIVQTRPLPSQRFTVIPPQDGLFVPNQAKMTFLPLPVLAVSTPRQPGVAFQPADQVGKASKGLRTGWWFLLRQRAGGQAGEQKDAHAGGLHSGASGPSVAWSAGFFCHVSHSTLDSVILSGKQRYNLQICLV